MQRLVLTSNSIEFLGPIPDPSDPPLPGLKHLSLSFNKLTSWLDIDYLSGWCPAIESLTLSGNPLVKGKLPYHAPFAVALTVTVRRRPRANRTPIRHRANPHINCARLRERKPSAYAPAPGLPHLYAQVTAKERTDSELFYLSWVNKHGPPDEEARPREYPRWNALCESEYRTGIVSVLIL